jgi:hypothetical protein
LADRIVTIGSGKTYSTIALALAGEADFQAGEDNIVFTIDNGAYASLLVTSALGFTTTATHRLVFKPASGNHGFARSSGVRIVSTGGYEFNILEKRHCDIYDMAFSMTGANSDGLLIFPQCRVINCFAYDCNRRAFGLMTGSSPQSNTAFINCVAVNYTTGFYSDNTWSNMYLYNCDALNGTTGASSTGEPVVAKNCYAGGNSTADLSGGAITVTNCRTSDGTRSTTVLSVANCYFTNSTDGSEDVHIASNSGLIDLGGDLSSDASYPFNYDGLNATRSGTWDIGAIEYIASVTGNTYYYQQQQM